MRKIFAINMTSEKDAKFDGDDFAVRRISDELYKKYESLVNEEKRENKPSIAQRLLRSLSGFCFGLGIILLIVIVRAVSQDGTFFENLKSGYANAPYVFIACPVSLLLFIALTIYDRKITKKANIDEKIGQIEMHEHEILGEIKENLVIPSDALTVDVLAYAYKYNRYGEPMPYSTYATHTPMECFLFDDADNLYIASYNAVFSFKKSEYVEIKENDSKIKLLAWNKNEDISEGRYKEYEMFYDNYGVVNANGFSSLVFMHGENRVEIDVPKYEVPVFLDFLSKKE
jgi:hypothetical protein